MNAALVVDVTSPSYTMQGMNAKRAFYEQYGVDEHWRYYPDGQLAVCVPGSERRWLWLSQEAQLRRAGIEPA